MAAPSPATPIADAIVVAAGSSRRMDGIDKLDSVVAGLPVLAHTLIAIDAAPEVESIALVTAAERIDRIVAADWLPESVRAVVAGGARRQESVAAGLAALDRLGGSGLMGDRVVLVHDGARPLVAPELVSRVVTATAEHGAAIPVVALTETLKRVDGGLLRGTIERDGLATAQTPQGVQRGLLRSAFARFPAAGPETWTDEAALLEACTIPVHAIAGDPANLKVTVPGDLDRVEAALNGRASGVLRVGIGQDLHPFGPGAPLMLGGVTIPGAPRLSGHSDGDVVLHAIADAILGAAGLGDLGRLFPAGSATPRGVASTDLLADVVRKADVAGLRVAGVDVTVVGARPRLGDALSSMAARIAGLVHADPGSVNVKASTGNLAGFEGAGRGMSALAIVTLTGTARSSDPR
jgi:2-C-methyl-D-erythritol 4-phosphate cytidylyltransferase / 2-C-methyl-D-erythritol 2,4-cyclodiphosphate synthase